MAAAPVGEAVLGGKVDVPTPTGTVSMTVPAHSDTGSKLRLRGRGVPAHGTAPAGDLYVTLRVQIGPNQDAELESLVRDWYATYWPWFTSSARAHSRERSAPSATRARTGIRSRPTWISTSGVVVRLWNQAGCCGAPPFEATTT